VRWSIRIARKVLAALAWAALGAAALSFTLYVMRARAMPDQALWHEPLRVSDFRARKDSGESFDDYLARETRLFEAVAALRQDVGDEATRISRYRAGGSMNPATHARNWNRTFVLSPQAPVGSALLLHGLSDSPYSLRALAELFRARGFAVVGLRIPGHGTVPGALVRARWQDWSAAVRIAARHTAELAGEDRPLVLVGYSNGAALAVDYALEAMAGNGDPRPAGAVMLSPAIGVSAVAGFARFQRRLAALPGLHKLGWTDILPEYDPYKYNSFPIQAGEQIYDLTTSIHERLDAAAERGALREFPPVLAFQSAVDATIPAASIVERLLDILPENGSELVLFDVNRETEAQELIRPAVAESLVALTTRARLPFTLTVLTNQQTRSRRIEELTRRPADASFANRPLDLEWPSGLFSLSHVAVPIPPDDFLYGAGGDPSDRQVTLGNVELRGERGLLIVSAAQLTRLRFNPFYSYLEARVAEAIDALIAREEP
jgi:alpha-beta hydrolase superfamily lysophospholipase